MPRKKDKNGKVYVWSDDGYAMYFQYYKAQVSTAVLAGTDEQTELIRYDEQNVQPLAQSITFGEGDYHHSLFHTAPAFAEQLVTRIVTENPNHKVTDYFLAEDFPEVKKYLKKVADTYRKKAQQLPPDKKYDKVRQYYEDAAYLATPDQGNLLEAYAKSPYIGDFADLGAGSPRFDTMGLNECIDGLNNQTDRNGKPQPAFDIIMDFQHVGTEELKTEFHRQRLEAEGWTPQSERVYLEELKATHQKALAAFDKLWALDDQGQYDQYLNNELDHQIGRQPLNNRDYNTQFGHIRGEVQAIENGWSRKDIQILGLVGAAEQFLKKKKIQCAGDKEQMESLTAFEEDLKRLKENVWNKKITSVDDKKEVLDQVRAFTEKHRENAVMQRVYYDKDYASRENYERAMEAVERDYAWEHEKDKLLDGVQTKEQMDFVEEAELQNTENLTALRVQTKELAMKAKEKLAALEKMTKKDHTDGPEYIAMHDALKKVSELDPAKDSIDNVAQAVENLNKSSNTYEKTHTGWFVATKGYGEQRKSMSVELQQLTADFQKEFKDKSSAYLNNSDRVIEDLIRHNAKSYPVIDNGRKVRNLSAEDLAQKMGVNNAPAEDFAKKRQEAEAKKPGLQLGSVNGQPVNGQPVNGPVIAGPKKQG